MTSMSGAPQGSVASAVTVQTIAGPVDASELGMTLMHEHTTQDLSEALHPGARDFSFQLAGVKASAANAWLLREDPYSCADNCRLDDEDATAEELGHYARAGGRTLVDNSTGASRDPGALLRLARRTGLTIVMGSGWSLAHGNDHSLENESTERLASELVAEHRNGLPLPDGSRTRPGIIGEIGVGPRFTRSEEMTLVAASIAQPQVGVPLLIHLPGWQRRGHDVLDIVLAQGVESSAVVLCHMDPSGKDRTYQRELADRGVWLEFDMIGMLCNFPGEGQSPSVEDTAEAVHGLITDEHGPRLLLSHDVFLKGMWTRHGGNGYGFVPTAFLPRLVELGTPAAMARSLLTANPASLFRAAAAVGLRSPPRAATSRVVPSSEEG